MRMLLIALAGLMALAGPAAGQADRRPAGGRTPDVVGKPAVLDGATLLFHRGQPGETRVALAGVVVPPLESYPYGRWAQLALQEAIGGRTVRCQSAGADHRGRLTARCQVHAADATILPGLVDLSLWIVEQGLAVPEPGSGGDDKQAAAERAQAAKRGIWSDFR